MQFRVSASFMIRARVQVRVRSRDGELHGCDVGCIMVRIDHGEDVIR